jgi:hypothetical protein
MPRLPHLETEPDFENLVGAKVPEETRMKGSKQSISFRKTATCPSANTLLLFRTGDLTSQMATLVTYHLQKCDFCRCEIMLLAHHRRGGNITEKTPDIPMNLRILAEAILCKQ